MVIPRELLRKMSEAVAGFWDVMDYVYTESLNKKHKSVERRLPGLRTQFAEQIRQNPGIPGI